MSLTPRKLNRKELRAIKKNGVDVHKIMIEVAKSVSGEDIDVFKLMEYIDPDVMDAVLDLVFPNNQAQLDEMSQTELLGLTSQIISLTFGGEEEKKS